MIDSCHRSHPAEQYPFKDLAEHHFKDSDIDSGGPFVKGSRTSLSSSVQCQAEIDKKQPEGSPVLRGRSGLAHRRIGIQDLGALIAKQHLASDLSDINVVKED